MNFKRCGTGRAVSGTCWRTNSPGAALAPEQLPSSCETSSWADGWRLPLLPPPPPSFCQSSTGNGIFESLWRSRGQHQENWGKLPDWQIWSYNFNTISPCPFPFLSFVKGCSGPEAAESPWSMQSYFFTLKTEGTDKQGVMAGMNLS